VITIGRKNRLNVLRKVEFGMYLDGAEHGEILLPTRYVPEGCNEGDEVEVFLYFDSEDRLIATTETPYTQVGEFAYLTVLAVNSVGAFLDWGLMKDLFVPFREQKIRMVEGKQYLVHTYLDHNSMRIAASAKVEKFFNKDASVFTYNQVVDLLVYAKTDMGYKTVINKTHAGMLFKADVFRPLELGKTIKGFIKNVRADGKIDVYLNKPGYQKVMPLADKILNELQKASGYLPISDKSSPEVIYQTFHVSKATYKKAIGSLYKQKKISISKEGIRLC